MFPESFRGSGLRLACVFASIRSLLSIVRRQPMRVSLRGGATGLPVAATVHEAKRCALNPFMVSKLEVCLASKPSRHQRSDGDCALRLGTLVVPR
jgi:hypothetical protein